MKTEITIRLAVEDAGIQAAHINHLPGFGRAHT